MVRLTAIDGSDKALPKPVAEIYLRRNLSSQQIDEVRARLERSAKGPFSVQETRVWTVVEVTAIEDLALMRTEFPRIVNAWKEIAPDDE